MPRLLPLLLLTLAAPAPAAGPGWQAGFAKVAITPEAPLWMSGYAARSAPAEGKDTDLWARAAVLRDAKGHTAVLVTLDLVGIDRDLSKALVQPVRDKHALPREAVAVCVTHTHCGPVVGTNLKTMYVLDPAEAGRVAEYTAALPKKVLQAVDAAVAALRPVTLSWAVGEATFAVNRRENKEADVPALRAKGLLKGPTDHAVPVLAARTAAGKLAGVVFGYACHATVLSYLKWNADYPGYAVLDVEAAHPGAIAMFVAGCGADQNPLPRRSVELAKGYGKQLADAVSAVVRKPMDPVAPAWKGVYAEVELPFKEVPTRDELARQAKDANKYVAARARLWLDKLESGGSVPAYYPYPVQTWRLGAGPAVVLLGGEVVVDYALRLKKDHGPGVWPVGYANDVMAYVPSARVLREGGYEGATAMVYYGLPAAWGPAVEDVVVAEAGRQLGLVRRE